MVLSAVRAAPWGPWLRHGVPGRSRLHTVIIAVGRAARATAESTTSSQNVILAVRHVDAAASKTRRVDAGTSAGEGKSAPVAGSTRWASLSARSAQIRECGKCSPGFSDTLGVQVRPVGVYAGNVVLLRL